MKTLTQRQLDEIAESAGLVLEPCGSANRLYVGASGEQVDVTGEVQDIANAAFVLGAAQEREACMNLCEVLALDPYKEQVAKDCARKIKERNKP